MRLFLTLFFLSLFITLSAIAYFFLKNNGVDGNGGLPFTSIQKQETEALAQPSYGPMAQTVSVRMAYDNESDTAQAFLMTANPITEKAIQVGKSVILFDRLGAVLPLGGTISDVKNQNGQNIYLVSLPTGAETSLMSAKGEIIIDERHTVPRLPKEAVITENDTSYIYLAENNFSPDSSALKTEVNILYEDMLFYQISTNNLPPEFFVLLDPPVDHPPEIILKNPEKVILDAPLHTPVKQAYLDYEAEKIAAYNAMMLREIARCGQGLGADPSTFPQSVVDAQTRESNAESQTNAACRISIDSLPAIQADRILDEALKLYRQNSGN